MMGRCTKATRRRSSRQPRQRSGAITSTARRRTCTAAITQLRAQPGAASATLLATMKDDDGRVIVKGYYDGVKLTDAERKSGEVPDDEKRS